MSSNAYVALLRGINVGGHNKLPMKSLASMFERAGCGHVSTYIQSGNVVFTAGAALAARIPELIKQSIIEEFGYEIPIVTRTAAELDDIVAANPYARAGIDERELHVAFLADQPAATAVAALDPNRSPPAEFVVHGCEIYLRYPEGLARTKLTNAYFDSRLATTSTVRNWKTTLRVAELAARASGGS